MVHLSARKAFIFQSKRKILHFPDLFFDLFSWTSNHILLDWSDVTKTTLVHMDCFFAKIIVPGNGCVSDQCILYFEYFASYFQKTNKKSVIKVWNFSNYKREQRLQKFENLRILKRLEYRKSKNSVKLHYVIWQIVKEEQQEENTKM